MRLAGPLTGLTGQSGALFHEYAHTYFVLGGLASSALGTQRQWAGHWGWTAFPDARGVLGGFNYFLCPGDGGEAFSMDPSKDP